MWQILPSNCTIKTQQDMPGEVGGGHFRDFHEKQEENTTLSELKVV